MKTNQVYTVFEYQKLSHLILVFLHEFFTCIVDHDLLDYSRVLTDDIQKDRGNELSQDFHKLVELLNNVTEYHIELHAGNLYYLHIWNKQYWLQFVVNKEVING